MRLQAQGGCQPQHHDTICTMNLMWCYCSFPLELALIRIVTRPTPHPQDFNNEPTQRPSPDVDPILLPAPAAPTLCTVSSRMGPLRQRRRLEVSAS